MDRWVEKVVLRNDFLVKNTSPKNIQKAFRFFTSFSHYIYNNSRIRLVCIGECIGKSLPWGSKIGTHPDFERSISGCFANGLDFKWDLKS